MNTAILATSRPPVEVIEFTRSGDDVDSDAYRGVLVGAHDFGVYVEYIDSFTAETVRRTVDTDRCIVTNLDTRERVR